MSTLYVSSKLHDTLKKPRDIILASYGVRYPQLVKKGVVDPAAVDANMLEGERKRVLGIERLILETVCFKFSTNVGLDLVAKLGRAVGGGFARASADSREDGLIEASKELCQQAWRIAVDCYRTPAALSFPPHIIALASLYTAAILCLQTTQPQSGPTDIEQSSEEYRRIISLLGNTGDWEQQYYADWGQIDGTPSNHRLTRAINSLIPDVTHYLIDLYNTILSIPISDPSFISSPSPISPKEQPSQQPTQTTSLTMAFKLPAFWMPQNLTELKIHLRDRRPGNVVAAPWPESVAVEESEVLGKNDATIRFVWDAEAAAA